MRFRRRHAPLVLLLLPSLATAAATPQDGQKRGVKDTRVSESVKTTGSDADQAVVGAPSSPTSPLKSRYEAVGTKDAPVDGKDGKPHLGPWVETSEGKKKGEKQQDVLSGGGDDGGSGGGGKKNLPPLKGRPDDPTMIDGKKIPETNDGVMDDPDRLLPKQGTTGTEGGVTEKDKARKAKEDKTGEKTENRPETPKEAPPLPHSEEEKLLDKDAKKEKAGKAKDKTKAEEVEEIGGLEKPVDLPDRTHDTPHPVPDSANKDHLDVPKTKPSHKAGSGGHAADDDKEGLITPFHSFILSLTMILVSEVGDKTFLVAALMAMKHDRIVVFTAAFGALITMTVLSAVLGHTLPALVPKRLTNFLAAALFFVFGARLLREGMAMSPDEGVAAEMQEVEMELAEKESRARRDSRRKSSSGAGISAYALEMGFGGGGGGNNRGRKSRSKSRFPTPPRSPSTSPGRSPSPRGGAAGAIAGFAAGFNNLCSLLLSPAWVQTFVMTFLGEWGDRSQIATIAMAAGQDYWWVTLGALAGHACCTGVAVVGGRAIAGRVSMKVVTIGGAVAFLVFGFIYLVEAFYI